MNTNELKAVLDHTKEVAIHADHIGAELPPYITVRRKGVAVCPRGLVHATVIETGAAWVERRPVAECGDQEYDITHRNGVLVELAPDALNAAIAGRRVYYKHNSGKRSNVQVPHTSVIERNGEKRVRMIVSHRAIIAPWGEYTLIEAQRQKDEDEYRAKQARVSGAMTALMGMDREQCAKIPLNGDYVQEYEYGENGSYKRDAEGRRIVRQEKGRVQITVERAEELLAILTPKQKRTLGIK